MSTRTDEMKKEIKGFGTKAKEFVKDNVCTITYFGVLGGLTIGAVVSGRRYSKKMDALWHEAKRQLDSGNITNFGPYKICKFFEPDGTFMGQLPFHESNVKVFLDLK